MRLRRPLPAVQGDTLHIVGVGDNRIGKDQSYDCEDDIHEFLKQLTIAHRVIDDLHGDRPERPA